MPLPKKRNTQNKQNPYFLVLFSVKSRQRTEAPSISVYHHSARQAHFNPGTLHYSQAFFLKKHTRALLPNAKLILFLFFLRFLKKQNPDSFGKFSWHGSLPIGSNLPLQLRQTSFQNGTRQRPSSSGCHLVFFTPMFHNNSPHSPHTTNNIKK